MVVPPITDTERFLARVEQRGANQCWWWTGAIEPRGYPRLRLAGGRQVAVARFAWEIVYLRGPIPHGFVVVRGEHDWDPCPDPKVCIHRMCMNPAHLRLAWKPGLDAERLRAWAEQQRVHCRRNHPLTEDNTLWLNRARNKRVCKICHNQWLVSNGRPTK